MSRIDRNAPCPCGSGVKYKKCCLPKDEASAPRAMPPPSRPRPSRDVRETAEMVDAVLDFAVSDLGIDLENFTAPIPEHLLDRNSDDFFTDLGLFHLPIADKGSVGAQYLQVPRPVHPHQAEVMLAAWATILEVVEARPGEGFVADDLLTGERLEIADASVSRDVRRGDGLMALPSFRRQQCVLTIVHPDLLPPDATAKAVEMSRRAMKLRGKKPATRSQLSQWPAMLAISLCWAATVDAHAHRPEPQLQNTDGDPLLVVSDHFEVMADRGELLRALASIEGAQDRENTDEGAVVTFLREGNPMHAHWENTVIGRAVLRPDGRLLLETNSERRADALRARVEAACGAMVSRKGRELGDPRSMLERAGPRLLGAGAGAGAARPSGLPPEVEAQVLRDYKAKQYAAWPDVSLPALDGQTPREAAAGTPKQRKRLLQLLKEMEFAEDRSPAAHRYDFGIVRRELGLPPR